MMALPSIRQLLAFVCLASLSGIAVSWECPAPRNIYNLGPNKCHSDADCVDRAKCCAFDDEYACWKLDEYDRASMNCPDPGSKLSPTSCYDKCHSDHQCEGGRVCCQSECGKTCYPPIKHQKIKSVVCPAQTDQRDFRCDYPCSVDADCTNMGRCCNFACGRSCWWTPDDKWNTATVRGDCEYKNFANVGERNFQLSCELLSKSNNKMSVQWMKGDKVMSTSYGRVHTEMQCMDVSCKKMFTHLVFEEVRTEDSGKYMMIVTSGSEKYGHLVQLNDMFNEPQIVISPESMTVDSGGTASFTCRITNLQSANPYYGQGIKLKWCHRGLSNADYQGIHTHQDGQETLTLRDVYGDVTIACGLNSTDCTVKAKVTVRPNDNNGCPVSVDIRNYAWPWTQAGITKQGPCPQQYTGTSTRSCTSVSTWLYPNYYKCVHNRIRSIDRSIQTQMDQYRRGELRQASVQSQLAKLNSAAQEIDLTGGDIDGILNSITGMVILVKVTNTRLGTQETKYFIGTIGSTLSEKHLREWNVLLKETDLQWRQLNQSAAMSILKSIKEVGLQSAGSQTSNQPINVQNPSLLFGAGRSKPEDLRFPVYNDYQGRRQRRSLAANSSSIHIQKATMTNLLTKTNGDEVKWTYAIYNTLARIMNLADETSSDIDSLSFFKKGNLKVVSEVVSVFMEGPDDVLVDPPISTQMKLILDTDEKKRFFESSVQRDCGRLVDHPVHKNISQWTSSGCKLLINESDIICECNKFGHIAVLAMMPEEHGPLLMLAIKIASAIPILGAIIIMIVKIKRGCCVPSSVLSTNMSLATAAGFALLIYAVDQTYNQLFCGQMAIGLHFLFSVSILSVLGQTVHQVLTYRLKSSLGTSTMHAIPFVMLISAWGVGAGIVAATVCFSGVYAYGSDDLCWIVLTFGTSSALLGPGIFVLLVHVILLAHTVCNGHSYYENCAMDEKMGVKSGYTVTNYTDDDDHETNSRNTVLLKIGLRSVYIFFDLLCQGVLILMTVHAMDDHVLEYLFVTFVGIKTILLVYVDAYLKDIDNQDGSRVV